MTRAAPAICLALLTAGCDEPPPHPMMLMQAASGTDGDAQQARAAFAEAALREQLQPYFGERFFFAEQQSTAGPAAPLAVEVPAF